MHTHPTGYMRQYHVSLFELDMERGVGQRLQYRAVNLYRFFFRQISFPTSNAIDCCRLHSTGRYYLQAWLKFQVHHR